MNIKIPNLNVIMLNTSQISGYESNPKTHPKEQLERIKASIKSFGMRNPILLNNPEERLIIAGHGRLQACQELGMIEVPVLYATDLTPNEAKAFRIMDNKSQESVWDDELLGNELEFLKEQDFDLSLTGFGTDEINDLLDIQPADDEYEMPEQPVNTRNVIKGDVYQLGNHRLMCGDATIKEDVDKLMNGKKADMCFIDPPYGVGYEEKSDRMGNETYNHINGDENLERAKNIWKYSFQNIYEILNNGSAYYVTAPQGGDQMMMMMMMMMEGNIKCKHELIWVKPSPVFSMGRLDYDYQHEPILYGWKGSHKFKGKGKFTKSIWHLERDVGKLHPTMKPVELIINAIMNSSDDNNLIIDLFGGSGSTLIAAEQTNRVCYMLEIDPIYCSIIIDRYVKLTGKQPTKEA